MLVFVSGYISFKIEIYISNFTTYVNMIYNLRPGIKKLAAKFLMETFAWDLRMIIPGDFFDEKYHASIFPDFKGSSLIVMKMRDFPKIKFQMSTIFKKHSVRQFDL